MNDLSLILYLADVLPALDFWAEHMAFLCFILAIICLIPFVVTRMDSCYEKAPSLAWPLVLFVSFFFIFSTVSMLLPSRQTILLIAASEAAETVIVSEEGQEILSDLKRIIKRELGEFADDGVNL